MKNINKWIRTDISNQRITNTYIPPFKLKSFLVSFFLQSCVCADFMLNNNFKRVPVEDSRDQQME